MEINFLTVFIAVLFIGLAILGTVDDLCEDYDWFSGRIFSRQHQYEHINRELNEFFYILSAALVCGGLAFVISCFQAEPTAPHKVFIQDLVKDAPLAKETGTTTNSKSAHKNTHKVTHKESHKSTQKADSKTGKQGSAIQDKARKS